MINKRFGIRKTINTASSKSCPGSYTWLTRTDGIKVWSNDPAEAKTWETAEQAKQYKRNANLKGTVIEIR